VRVNPFGFSYLFDQVIVSLDSREFIIGQQHQLLAEHL
jgi:hypothetical protein